MPQQLPFDYDVEQAALKRRQAMIDSMTGQIMKPTQGQMIGNRYVGPGIADAVSKVLSAYFLSNHQDKLDESQRDLQGRYNTGLQEALGKYEQTRLGTPAKMGPSMAPTVDNDPANPKQVEVSPAIPGDPRKAAIEAIVSSYGPMRDIGLNDLKESAKQAVTLKDLLPHADPASIPAMLTQGQAGFKPKAELKAFQPGEVVLDAGGRVFTPQGAPIGTNGGPGWGTTTINGDLYQQSATGLKKLDNAPKITVTPNVQVINKGEESFMKQFGEQTAKQLNGIQEGKANAQRMLTVADRLESLNKAGTFSGPTANAATSVAQFANALGIPVDQRKLNNSQEYAAVLGKQVAQVLTTGSGVGRSMTDADREAFMSQFPTLVNSPEGRQRIIGMLRDGARQDIQYADQVHKNLQSAYPEAARLFGIVPSTQGFPNAQPAASTAPGKVMSLDEYLKAQGGR